MLADEAEKERQQIDGAVKSHAQHETIEASDAEATVGEAAQIDEGFGMRQAAPDRSRAGGQEQTARMRGTNGDQ